jgi:hypothetical protein
MSSIDRITPQVYIRVHLVFKVPDDRRDAAVASWSRARVVYHAMSLVPWAAGWIFSPSDDGDDGDDGITLAVWVYTLPSKASMP